MRYKGKITKWKDDQGFGFITPDGGGQQVFFHIKTVSSRQRRPVENDLVTYEVNNDDKGRLRAVNVVLNNDSASLHFIDKQGIISIVLTMVLITVLLGATKTGKLPLWVIIIYIFASLIAFIAYALDKLSALNNRWRTQENTLHLIALVGGWPGALAAQRFLRHKSKKQPFQFIFWTTVAINCAVLGWLISFSGSEWIRSVFGTP